MVSWIISLLVKYAVFKISFTVYRSLPRQEKIHLVTTQHRLQRYQIGQNPHDLC